MPPYAPYAPFRIMLRRSLVRDNNIVGSISNSTSNPSSHHRSCSTSDKVRFSRVVPSYNLITSDIETHAHFNDVESPLFPRQIKGFRQSELKISLLRVPTYRRSTSQVGAKIRPYISREPVFRGIAAYRCAFSLKKTMPIQYRANAPLPPQFFRSL